MFMKTLALFLFPALAAAVAQDYGPPAGPTTSTSGSTSSSAKATAPTVAPTAPADTTGQMNVCPSFLACSVRYTDKSASRLTLHSIRRSYSTLQIFRHPLARL